MLINTYDAQDSLTRKDYLALNVNSAEAEKPRSRCIE